MTQLVILRMGSIDLMLSKLNSSHPNTQFTYKVEEEKTLSFLGVLLITSENFIETKVYQKPINNDIYLSWVTFTPNTWKRRTSRTLIEPG